MRYHPEMQWRRWKKAVVILLAIGLAGCATPPAAPTPPKPLPDPVLIHLPGIGGELNVDRNLVNGLVDGGVAPRGQIVDWTGTFRGLMALGAVPHHHQQAADLADRLTRLYRTDPRTPIILTAHSGGAGIAVWALERLPEDVKIDSLLMLAPALSPGYDLSRALAHTRQALSFYSPHDNLVLGAGTRALGTIDRVHTDAAGYVGFETPESADPSQYAKLTQYPYDREWVRLGNYGDHIGATGRTFAARFIAPRLRSSP